MLDTATVYVSCSEVFAKGVLFLARTDLPPPRAQRSEIHSRRSCPIPAKQKRVPVVCLITVPVTCLDTAAAGLSFPLKPLSIFFGRRVLSPWMYAVFYASKCSYGLVCCAVTEQQCLTAIYCVTAPTSCFDTELCLVV